MLDKDKKKLVKAGFATPRGGAKGAYQNHVVRSNQVIVPYERYNVVPLHEFQDGYVVRLYPEQFFAAPGVSKTEFQGPHAAIKVGINAFVLYRTHESYKRFPPLPGWEIRHLDKDGRAVKKRGKGVVDKGDYVLRLSTAGGDDGQISEGAPQGLFAPEYADLETNYLSTCVLAWLIVHTVGSPYTTTQARHLQAVLSDAGLLDETQYEFKGIIRHGLSCCPLCLRLIRYEQLHDMVSFDDAVGNENAADQVEGATRSTIVNLFHIQPLRYDEIRHIPENVAWGHAVCNTRLGQRTCLSLAELIEMDLKVGIIRPEGIETFGWISSDYEIIRSPLGAVWIQISQDMAGDEDTTPPSSGESENSIPQALQAEGDEGVEEMELEIDDSESEF